MWKKLISFGILLLAIYIEFSMARRRRKPQTRTRTTVGSRALAANEGQFLLLTDLHVDVKYDPLGDSSNKCHFREGHANDDGEIASKLGIYGNRNCDSSPALVDFMMGQAKRQLPEPAFIVWAGDTPAHIDYTKEEFLQTMKKGVDDIKKHFGKTLVIPVIGNHDMRTSKADSNTSENIVRPTSISDDPSELGLYEDIFELWKEWIGDAPKETFLRGGYYRFKSPLNGPDFLVLNTNIYYDLNKKLKNFLNPEDPTGQFAFMESVLKDVRQNGGLIHILGHIPPGGLEWNDNSGTEILFEMPNEYNKKLLDLFTEFASSIGWMLFSHLHTDTFRIIKNSKGTPIQRIFLSPAITPIHKLNNPAFRIFHYNRINFDLIDIRTHYVDLDVLNKKGNKTEAKLEYSMRQAYGLGSLDANALNDLVERMDRKKALYNKYMRYRMVMHNQPGLKPDRAAHLCTISNLDLDKLKECLTIKKGKRRNSKGQAKEVVHHAWMYAPKPKY